MKNIFFYFIWYLLSIKLTNANDSWILWWWISWDKLREWDIHIDDIPNIIKWMIDFWMWIAWTISIIFIIVWAYQILFWSLTQDKSKWKNTIIMAVIWFAIASLSWFIIRLIIDNLS